jgi:hypothetical protein
MRTLPREPWRGGQICGWQTNVGGWSEGAAAYCGEFKKLGSLLCEAHDRLERMDGYGSLPKFAPGKALGLELTFCSTSWVVRDAYGELVRAASTQRELADWFGFTLRWEPYEGPVPVIPTAEELAAFQAQLEEASA